MSKLTITVGERYTGFGRTWEVIRVWKRERVVEVQDVTDNARILRWPMSQFKEFTRSI